MTLFNARTTQTQTHQRNSVRQMPANRTDHNNDPNRPDDRDRTDGKTTILAAPSARENNVSKFPQRSLRLADPKTSWQRCVTDTDKPNHLTPPRMLVKVCNAEETCGSGCGLSPHVQKPDRHVLEFATKPITQWTAAPDRVWEHHSSSQTRPTSQRHLQNVPPRARSCGPVTITLREFTCDDCHPPDGNTKQLEPEHRRADPTRYTDP